jgi:AcrR family transcriptional regulator
MSSEASAHIDPGSGPAPVAARRRQGRADVTREALLDAALHEFAAHGFDGASTRAIATRAGTHQPQINYHFASKEALWQAAVDHLFGRLDDLLRSHGALGAEVAEDRAGFERMVRGFVRAAAGLPELNRIMVHEATADSDRLAWIVARHTRPRFDLITGAWRTLRDAGEVADIDEVVVYYSLIGAASLAYANAPEARHLGCDTLAAEFVDRHADALVAMLCGPIPTEGNES